MIKAYAANEAKGLLKPIEYDPGELGEDQVEIAVSHCGICHSDLSMLNNDWNMTNFPFVPGHEIVGRIEAKGRRVTSIQIGQCVGLGWFSQSCMTCNTCISGDHHLCHKAEGVIVGRHGGFADKVRCHYAWAIPLPDQLNPAAAGPLFCGGITVFNPIIINDIKPTSSVGVIGIGGLGHLALMFLNAWGCEVTAFSTSPEKQVEAEKLGAHHFVNTRNKDELARLTGTFDLILNTVNVDLDWDLYLSLLRPKGRFHIVGAAETISIPAFSLIMGQKSIGGSPLGNPATITKMLEFAVRHKIEPMIETFPMSRVNDAMEKLRTGKPRFRLVLKNDF